MEARGWGLTLVTPYVTDAFIDRVDGLVDLLAATPGDHEVLVNDWGVLRRLHRRAPPKPRAVLGTGLNRMIRDPRVPDVGPEHLGGDASPDSWHGASHDSSLLRALLRRFGVERVETEVPLQGLDRPAAGAGPLSVHLPYGMVASGRVCLVNALGKPAAVRLTAPLACDAPCRLYTLELRAPWSSRTAGADALPAAVRPGEVLPLTRLLNRRRNRFPEPAEDPQPRFLQKGNTHFYELEGEALQRALRWAVEGDAVDRIVVEPDLPM